MNWMKRSRAIAIVTVLGTSFFSVSAAIAMQPVPKPKPIICVFIPYLCDLGIL